MILMVVMRLLDNDILDKVRDNGLELELNHNIQAYLEMLSRYYSSRRGETNEIR